MKLHYNVASPFVRKVMAVAIETGQDGRLEPVTPTMTPIKPDADLVQDNPLGKVPCLVTDDGAALYDSRVICEYLDSLHDGPKMFPPAGPARWRALRRQAEGDGIMDAAVLARYETFLRPKERRWPEWIEGQKAEVPPRPRQPRGRGRRVRRHRRHRHDHASAARSATSISATATRTGGRRGRGSPPGSSASRSGRRWPGPRRSRSGDRSGGSATGR